MRSFLSKLRQGAAAFLAGLGLFGLLAGPAGALNVPPEYAPRSFQSQQIHYVRANLQFTSCVQVANACTIKIPAALPYNAAILRVTAVVHTAFNSTTSDVVTLGTSTNANEIVSSGMNIHAQGLVSGTVLATASSATGNGATQTGLNGGFDLFMKWTAGTGNTATTGNLALVIEYVAPNDGSCTPVPLNTTATGC